MKSTKTSPSSGVRQRMQIVQSNVGKIDSQSDSG